MRLAPLLPPRMYCSYMGIEILSIAVTDKNRAAPVSLSAVRSTTEVSIIVAIDEWQESLLFYRHFRAFLPIPVVYF